MKHKKYWIFLGLLIGLAAVIHLFSINPLWVERYYSTGIYPSISFFLKISFGWLPFSIGDILYAAIVLWLLIQLVKVVKWLFKRQFTFAASKLAIQRLAVQLLLVYILFNLLWGINYNRKGIGYQLGLSKQKYSVNELKTLNGILLQKVNAGKAALLQKPAILLSSKEIFSQSLDAYKQVHKVYPFLNYHPPSIKSSLWGWLGNYVGFLGYYNPFTGEAQVNTTVPTFLQPYTSCHEIAHQIGYAKENEANFVGYLAAAASNDPYFHYSAYLDLFLYANRNLFDTDSIAAKTFVKQLLPAIKDDLREWRRFNMNHKNPVEPVVRWMYGKYLERNEQPSGMLSYDEVTGLLIAYYKKYGKL